MYKNYFLFVSSFLSLLLIRHCRIFNDLFIGPISPAARTLIPKTITNPINNMSLTEVESLDFGRCLPAKHSFLEHKKSGKIYCVKCATFLGAPVDIAQQVQGEGVADEGPGSDGAVSPEERCEGASHSFVEHSKSGRLFCKQCGVFAGRTEDISPVDHMKAFISSTKQGAMKLSDNAKVGAKKLGENAKKLGDGAKKMTETVKVGSTRLGRQFPTFGRNKNGNTSADGTVEAEKEAAAQPTTTSSTTSPTDDDDL